ncbi:MAG TPA: baseplate J/gp47 family protein [Pyrinomonadaceae bacterium]|jgi:hypothetical protein|nr:baseplate J/gp47 family protein [Pyrinomonadaceae bacterium]
MYNEQEKPLRDLARPEPLAKRARAMSEASKPGSPNGIKLVRVVKVDRDNDIAELEVYFFNDLYLTKIADRYKNDLTSAKNLLPISGGVRVRAGSALGQVQVDSSGKPLDAAIIHEVRNMLRLIVTPIGDYSTYTLRVSNLCIRDAIFDPLFSEIRFKFRPACFNSNCAPEWEEALPPVEEPAIDYLAKDYGSFRQTMIAAMMKRVPEWEPTSETDLDMVLAELFSAAADELSDYQDRVMNEAFITSARKRVSIARHSRLMDYHIHQGSQASTWLALEIEKDSGAKEFQLNEGLEVWSGENSGDTDKQAESLIVFTSRHSEPQTVHQYLNNIGIYTWSDTITTLKAGSTRADLKLYETLYLDDPKTLVEAKKKGDAKRISKLIREKKIKYLLIQEHLNPETGLRAGRDPAKRQLLQLKSGREGAEALQDPITGEWFVRVRWEKADKLRHDYCFTVDCPADGKETANGKVENISLFHGNLVKVFHGRMETVLFEDESVELNEKPLKPISPDDPLRLHYQRTRWGTLCRLPEVALAYKQTTRGGDVPPVSTLEVRIKNKDSDERDTWNEVPSLIHSDDSAENGDHFVVETDENRRSVLRFGNGKNGMKLPDGATVECTYQAGLPLEGNVGSDSIVGFNAKSIAAKPDLTIKTCWNPFDVIDGVDREPVAEIIRRVPEAYRQRQLRAVTLADYVERAREIKDVSRATAAYAWTGNWRTVRVTIDPVGTTELSPALRKEVSSYLNAVRLIGEDIEIRPPVFIPLEIVVKLCAAPDFWPEDIRFVLEQEFSSGWTPDGRMGFFHPDLWTFGQKLYASQIIGRALQVKGVDHTIGQRVSKSGISKTVSVSIQRWNSRFPPGESLTQVAPNEIIRVDNDPNNMEAGSIKFEVKGGRQ